MSIKSLPYEQQAYHNEQIPQGLGAFDTLAYLALRGLYSSHRVGEISTEQAAKEKREITKALEQAMYFDEVNQHYAKVINATEQYRREYRQNRTLETADKLIDVFDGFSRDGLEDAK